MGWYTFNAYPVGVAGGSPHATDGRYLKSDSAARTYAQKLANKLHMRVEIKANRSKHNPVRRNVQAGFWAGGKFHPLRRSADYDEERAGDEYGARTDQMGPRYLTRKGPGGKRVVYAGTKPKAKTRRKTARGRRSATKRRTKSKSSSKRRARRQNPSKTKRIARALQKWVRSNPIDERTHAKLLHVLTEYDRKQSAKPYYNHYALGHYMGALHQVDSEAKHGSLRTAIISHFLPPLTNKLLKAAGEPGMTQEERFQYQRV